MKTFDNYTIEQFNLVTGTNLTKNMTFREADEEIEKQEVSYFYISMNKNDVLEAIENEKEVAEALDLRLINIQDLGIFIATY